MAGGPLEAGGHGTVIDVLTAVLARPAIDTDAVVATMVVVAGATILAGIGHQLALIHILGAVLTCEGMGHHQFLGPRWASPCSPHPATHPLGRTCPPACPPAVPQHYLSTRAGTGSYRC